MDNNTFKRKVQVNLNPIIDPNAIAKVIIQGDKFADATICEKKVYQHTRKLNKDEYVVLSTGEIKRYRIKPEYKKQIENLTRTFGCIKHIIRTNFATASENQLFITLTYNPELLDKSKFPNGLMTDREKLYIDFKLFFQKLKRYLKKHKLEYLVVCEPHDSGAWHIHLMLKSDKPVLILDNDKETAVLWGHGQTKTKRLKSDDIGTYYTSYFTDLIKNESGRILTDDEIEKLDSKQLSKMRKKGARLHFYPAHFKFYRKSAGIICPPPEERYVKDLYDYYGEPVFAREYEIVKEYNDDPENTEHLNSITKLGFKRV